MAQCSDIQRRDGEGEVCLAEIDLERVESIRQGEFHLERWLLIVDMPLWEQRRNDVYPVI